MSDKCNVRSERAEGKAARERLALAEALDQVPKLMQWGAAELASYRTQRDIYARLAERGDPAANPIQLQRNIARVEWLEKGLRRCLRGRTEDFLESLIALRDEYRQLELAEALPGAVAAIHARLKGLPGAYCAEPAVAYLAELAGRPAPAWEELLKVQVPIGRETSGKPMLARAIAQRVTGLALETIRKRTRSLPDLSALRLPARYSGPDKRAARDWDRSG